MEHLWCLRVIHVCGGDKDIIVGEISMDLITYDNAHKIKDILLNGYFDNKSINLEFKNIDAKVSINGLTEAEKEQLLSAVVGAMGTDGKVDSTKISLPDGFQKDDSKSTETKLVVKGKEGIYWEVNLDTVAIKEYD